jgi:hypothetical protein
MRGGQFYLPYSVSGSMEDVKIHYFFPKYTVFHVFMFSQYIDKLILTFIRKEGWKWQIVEK